MPSRWQREYTCDWCAARTTRVAGELHVPTFHGWRTQWRFCHDCTRMLFELRGQMTYSGITAFQQWLHSEGAD